MGDLAGASATDLENIEGIGRVIAESIADWFLIEENRQLVLELEDLGVNIVRLPEEAPPRIEASAVLNKTFVLTGTLPTLSRKDAEDLIKKAGGRISGSVSKNTDFLVAGENPGSKFDRARELPNVKIISETELLHLLSP